MQHACADTNETSTLALGELDEQTVALLPTRDTLCVLGCVNVNVANVVGVNLAFAINAASTNTTANALAVQYLTALQ